MLFDGRKRHQVGSRCHTTKANHSAPLRTMFPIAIPSLPPRQRDFLWTLFPASITASATCGHSAGHRSPRTPLSSGAEVLWPRPEVIGVADTMIEARNLFSKPSSHHVTATMVFEKQTKIRRTLSEDTDMRERR